MALNSLASYPNSRVKPRPATSEGQILTPILEVSTGNNVEILPEDANRTTATLSNHSDQNIRYDYFDNPNMLTEGFQLKPNCSIDLESKQAIYAISEGASVAIQIDVGRG
jgi:hypothetical protein